MNKITVFNSRIEISDYTLGDCTVLEKTFSIYDRFYFKSYFKGIVYDEANKKMIVPRGIDIYWLERITGLEAKVDYSCDKYRRFDNQVMLKYLPRDDIQKTTLRFMTGNGEYKSNKHKSMLSVNLNTGAGKSYCSIATIAYFNMNAIIITDQREWLQQWKKYILEYTDIEPNEVYFINGSASIKRLYKRDISKYKIFLVPHATLNSYATSNGWESIGDLFKYLGIGIKIYDEAQYNFDNMYCIDYYTNSYLTYYVTATLGRSNKEENTIYQYYFKNVPSIKLFDEENDPHTKYLAFKFNSHPTAQQVSYCKNNYGLDRNKYIVYLTEQENFYYILHIILNIAKKTYGKFLLYIGVNEAILRVKEWIEYYYPEFINNVGIFTSIVTENKKEQLEKKIILSTTKSCGAAVDIKHLKVTVNLDEPFASEILAIQTLGRTRDEGTFYIDIVDEGFAQTKRFYNNKKHVFDKYASDCKEVKMTDCILEEKVYDILDKRSKMISPIEFYDETHRPKAIELIGDTGFKAIRLDSENVRE